ncbi:MAG: DUF4249 family protein [Bacteroidota bacterium]
MRSSFFAIALLLLVLQFLSCVRFTILPTPTVNPQLIVNGLFTPDSIWKINVSKNRGIDNNDFLPEYVSDALVSLWEEDSLLGQLAYAQNGNYTLDQYPRVNKRYRIEVEKEGFPTVKAIDSIPQIPSEYNVSWDLSNPVPVTDELGGTFASPRIFLDFQDVLGQKNYYKVSLAMRDSCNCANGLDLFKDNLHLFKLLTKDPIVPPNSRKHALPLFSDISFSDQQKQMIFFADTSFYLQTFFKPIGDSTRFPLEQSNPQPPIRKEKVEIYLDFWSFNYDLFAFYNTYLTQAYNTADPFATHVNVNSNIQGGRGIFAGYQRELILIYSH